MDGNKRRQAIIDILKNSLQPVSGTYLAKTLQVSRQVIVQDIALLRAGDYDIYSTHKGYVLNTQKVCKRIFKVHHDDNEVEKELSLIVDLGGYVEDVFVYHKVYNIVKATLNIASRRDIKNYMTNLQTGHSSLLKNVTSGYHYHTVHADSEEILDEIQEELQKAGFLAQLQEYEPVFFMAALMPLDFSLIPCRSTSKSSSVKSSCSFR